MIEPYCELCGRFWGLVHRDPRYRGDCWVHRGRRGRLALVILFVVFALVVFGWMVKRPEIDRGPGLGNAISFLALVEGQDFQLNPDSRTRSGENRISLLEPTRITLPSLSSHLRMLFKSGGEATFRGTGEIWLGKEGLRLLKGRFWSNFMKTPKGYRLRVPSAVLAIRGTEIKFDFSGEELGIELVTGLVDLIPDAGKGSRVEMQPGDRVLLKQGSWRKGTIAPGGSSRPAGPWVGPVSPGSLQDNPLGKSSTEESGFPTQADDSDLTGEVLSDQRDGFND